MLFMTSQNCKTLRSQIFGIPKMPCGANEKPSTFPRQKADHPLTGVGCMSFRTFLSVQRVSQNSVKVHFHIGSADFCLTVSLPLCQISDKAVSVPRRRVCRSEPRRTPAPVKSYCRRERRCMSRRGHKRAFTFCITLIAFWETQNALRQGNPAPIPPTRLSLFALCSSYACLDNLTLH